MVQTFISCEIVNTNTIFSSKCRIERSAEGTVEGGWSVQKIPLKHHAKFKIQNFLAAYRRLKNVAVSSLQYVGGMYGCVIRIVRVVARLYLTYRVYNTEYSTDTGCNNEEAILLILRLLSYSALQ